MAGREIKAEDKQLILQDLRSKVTGGFMYINRQYNNIDELFNVVPFEGFCSVADNMRFLYKQLNIRLSSWVIERYFHLFEEYDDFTIQKLI